MCAELPLNIPLFQVPEHNVAVRASRGHQWLAVRSERNRRDWAPILLELHHDFVEFQVEQDDCSIRAPDGDHIEGWSRLDYIDFILELLESVNQLALLYVPQLEDSLPAAEENLVQISRRMANGADLQLLIAERNLCCLLLVVNVPHFEQAVRVYRNQMRAAERQQKVNFALVPIKDMFRYMPAAPCEDLVSGCGVHEARVRGQSRDILGMQAAHTNQPKVVRTVNVKRSADTRHDNIVKSVFREPNHCRQLVAHVPQCTISLE